MSEEVGRSAVGVVGEAEDVDVTAAVAAAGGEARTGDVTDLLASSLDALVAVGEDALFDLATGALSVSVPVLPVAAGPGVCSVPAPALDAALDRLVDGEGERLSLPIVAVTVGGRERTRALADVTLVTAEPAKISEYAVRAGADLVSRFRADGVVVATPAGSAGYASTVGAPVVAHDTGVVAVAPIAPFQTDPDHWVLPADAVSLSVERDEVAVELLADTRTVGPVSPDTPIDLSRVDGLPVLRLPESESRFRA